MGVLYYHLGLYLNILNNSRLSSMYIIIQTPRKVSLSVLVIYYNSKRKRYRDKKEKKEENCEESVKEERITTQELQQR